MNMWDILRYLKKSSLLFAKKLTLLMTDCINIFPELSFVKTPNVTVCYHDLYL